MEKPTEAQIKAFWEWCGFKQLEWAKTGWHYEATKKVMNWTHPLLEYGSIDFLPRIDPNSLIRYAVPKLQDMGRAIDILCFEHKGFRVQTFDLFSPITEPGLVPITEAKDDDFALALFWAIWSVIKCHS